MAKTNFFDKLLSEPTHDRRAAGATDRQLENLPIESLHAGRFQRRDIQSQAPDLQELAQSIQAAGGIVQPIVVRPDAKGYEIIAGERRWRAAQIANLATVPCIIASLDDSTAALISGIENLQRIDLNPLEEAETYLMMMAQTGLNQRALANAVGRAETTVSKSIGLTKLDRHVRDLIAGGQLSGGHGSVLLGLSSTQQRSLASASVQNDWTVRKLEAAKRALKQSQSARTSKPKDPNLTDLQDRLTERFATRVECQPTGRGKGQGKITIYYHSLDECDGILEKMGISMD